MNLVQRLQNFDFIPFAPIIFGISWELDQLAKTAQEVVIELNQPATLMSNHGRDFFFVLGQYALFNAFFNYVNRKENPHLINLTLMGSIFLVYTGYEIIQHLATLPAFEIFTKIPALSPVKFDGGDVLTYAAAVVGGFILSYTGAMANYGIRQGVNRLTHYFNQLKE